MFDFTAVQEVRLSKGAHETPEKGMCFMEMAAWFAGEEHSDKPACVSPSLGLLGIFINDSMSDEDRDQSLKPMIPLVVGTFDEDAEPERIKYIVLRAFNYAMGAVMPEYGRRVHGGVKTVGDARHVLSWLRDYSRYGNYRHDYQNDPISAMKYASAQMSGDPARRRLAQLLEDMFSNRLPFLGFDAVNVSEVCNKTYDRDALTLENAKVAAGVFGYMAEIIPDWSAALDTLREAIKLGRHDGFTAATVNLERQHAKLRELVCA